MTGLARIAAYYFATSIAVSALLAAVITDIKRSAR